MDSSKKRRNSILKTPNSVRSERDRLDSGGDTGELGGGNVNSTRKRRVSFNHTKQVKEFTNTSSSFEGSFLKPDFNQTMVGGDIDMDISDISGGGDDDKRIENEKNSASSANRTNVFGEMSIVEHGSATSAFKRPKVPNPESGAISDGQQQQILETPRSFRSVEGFGSLNEENYSPNMGAGGGFRHDISVVDTPQNANKRQRLEEKNTPKEATQKSTKSKEAVSSATSSFYSESNHTIFAEPADMSVSSINLDQSAMLPSAPKKCRKNRMTISTSQNMSVAEPSSSSNQTRMAGSNADMSIAEAPASTVHSSANHTLFTGPGEMSFDGNETFKTPSTSRIPRKHRATMSVLKDMSTVESPRRTSERLKNKISTTLKLTRVDNADMSITEPIASTRHLEITKVTDSVNMAISTLDAPPALLTVAEPSHNGRKNVNSAPSCNEMQSNPLSWLEETSAGHSRSNSTMLTGPGDMSMFVVDKNAATSTAPVIDKTQRKNRMTICNPGDMSMEQSQNIEKLPKKNGAPLPSSVQLETPVVEPVVSPQDYQEHEDINGSEMSNPAPFHQEQIYPKITIRKSGAGRAPNLVRDPLGKRKIDKKQTSPAEFSFGVFGQLKTPKRRQRPIREPGPSITSKIGLKASIASQNTRQASAVLPRNEKCTKDVGLDCTIENQKDTMNSVVDINISTSRMFPTINIGKPVAKTIDMGTSPIVILGSGNLSANRSFVSSKLVEMTVTESSAKPTIPAAHRQERDPTERMAVDMSVSSIEAEPSPTPTAVQNTHRRNRMTLSSSKDMDVSLVQNKFPSVNTAESVEENNYEISFHPPKLNEEEKLSQPEQVISSAPLPSDHPNTGSEISTELVDISILSIHAAEPTAAHQSQKGQNGLSISASKLASNNRIDQGSYIIGTGHPRSSKKRQSIASVKGKDSTILPLPQNDDVKAPVQKSGSHHSEMVSMNMSSFSYQSQGHQHSDTENSSSDEDDMEQEDIQKDSASNPEEKPKKLEVNTCMKANVETHAEAILQVVQNNSIDDVPRPYSICR